MKSKLIGSLGAGIEAIISTVLVVGPVVLLIWLYVQVTVQAGLTHLLTTCSIGMPRAVVERSLSGQRRPKPLSGGDAIYGDGVRLSSGESALEYSSYPLNWWYSTADFIVEFDKHDLVCGLVFESVP